MAFLDIAVTLDREYQATLDSQELGPADSVGILDSVVCQVTLGLVPPVDIQASLDLRDTVDFVDCLGTPVTAGVE